MNFEFLSSGRLHSVKIEKQDRGYLATIDGKIIQFAVQEDRPDHLSLLRNGKISHLTWIEKNGILWIALDGQSYKLEKPVKWASSGLVEPDDQQLIRAPMPGLVRFVYVKAGDFVEKGQSLLILEAMKMEIRLTANRDGQVQQVTAAPGMMVGRDDLLITIVSS